jgi:hypothetical protein
MGGTKKHAYTKVAFTILYIIAHCYNFVKRLYSIKKIKKGCGKTCFQGAARKIHIFLGFFTAFGMTM